MWLSSVGVVSGCRRRPGKRRRAGRAAGGAPPFWYDESALDAEIAALEDDPDAMRVTVNVSVVVRVTRAKVLERFAEDVFAARGEALSSDDFAPLAYQAVCEEGLDDVTGGPAGQLRFLIDPGAIVAGIPGVAVEDARIVIERTPVEVVHRLRKEHGFLEEHDESPREPAGAEPPDRPDPPF